MGKKIMIIALVALLGLTFVGCSSSDKSETVAIVNDTVITQNQLDERVNQAAAMNGFDLSDPQLAPYVEIFQLQVLDSLIDEILIEQEAKNHGIAIAKADIEKEITTIKSQFDSEAEYKEYFHNHLKLSDKDISGILETQLLSHALYEEVTKEINSTEVDVEGYYNLNQQEFYEQEQVKARHILVETKEEALAIINEIKDGQDMAELAVLKSVDPTVASNQGDLGYFDRGFMVEEFDDAVFKMEVGEVTAEPVETRFGFHVIKLEDKVEERQRTFEEVKDELEERFIYDEKSEVFHNFMLKLRENAQIENRLEAKLDDESEPEKEIQK